MITNKEQAYNKMPEFIKNAIDKEIEQATEEEIEKAKIRIDKRKSEIIAGVILFVEKRMKIETRGEELTIIIENDNKLKQSL